MRKEILVSLGDSRLKELSEVLGSKSCVRILDLLGEEDLAVSDIAKKLNMRLNSVDYNVKKLVRAGLIEGVNFWWSVKGKKVLVYRVVDKRIVISPKRKIGEKFLLIFSLVGVGALLFKWLNFSESSEGVLGKEALFMSRPSVESLAFGGGNRVVESVGFWASLSGLEWFLFGVWSAMVLFFMFSLFSERGFTKSLFKSHRNKKIERRFK